MTTEQAEISRLKYIIKKHIDEAISQDYSNTYIVNEKDAQIRSLKKEIKSLKEKKS